MARPRFRPGVHVELGGARHRFETGLYEVLREMPQEGPEPRYRLRSLLDGHERVADEHELKAVEASAPDRQRPPKR